MFGGGGDMHDNNDIYDEIAKILVDFFHFDVFIIIIYL